MPAEARPRARRLPSGRWQLCYTVDGEVRSGGAFASKTEALNRYRDVIEPELQGRAVARRDVTLTELVDTYLERHGKVAEPTTVATLRWRMKRPLEDFGDTALVDLERMTDEIAGFAATLPERFRYPIMSAFRQTCAAGIRYGYMGQNPAKLAGKNPAPPPRSVRAFMPAELKALCEEFDRRGAAAITFAAATGLRPSEWAHVERRDVDRARRILTVRGTKTKRSLREIPLTAPALQALDSLVARLDSPYVLAGQAWPVRRAQLPSAQVEPGRRVVGDREARPPVRPALDVRLERARRGDHRVRARPDHGNERRDDRGALRCAPRHSTRVAPRAPGRRFGHESGMTARAETPNTATMQASRT